MLTGQNGILNRASEAKEKTEIASKDEQRKLAQAEALMNTGKTTYKGLILPEGFAPTKIEGEDSIDDGLVITDGYGNEYVWVEVPRTSEVYPTATVNITEFNNDAYINIENDLHTYTSLYRNNTSYTDTYAEDDTSGWFKDESEYNEAKQKMLKSVYENEGFWVGRYEAGISELRGGAGEITAIPVSKENMYPYTYVTRTQAEVLAEKVESGSCTSSLMFGVQWDLVLKYIENKKEEKIPEISKRLNEDSEYIGNYWNSKIKLNRGKYVEYKAGILGNLWNDYTTDIKGCVENQQKVNTEGTGIFITTGASESTNLQNIYDMAGNVWEWTIENSEMNQEKCVYRGGAFDSYSRNRPVSFRYYLPNNHLYYSVGFRVAIY